MEADLSDSFTVLSHFMFVSYDKFGSSWGLKADLGDSFTCLSRFMGALDPTLGYVGSVCDSFGLELTSKAGPKIIKHGVTNLINFGTVFSWCPICGPFWEPIWGQIGLRGAKMSPRRASRASRFRKLHTKYVIFKWKTILLESWRLLRRSQEGQEGSQEALEELQDFKIKVSKNGPENHYFVDKFWSRIGTRSGL